MVVTKLLYLLLLAGLAVFYVLYIDSLPLMLLICAAILPVILRIGLTWVHFCTEASIRCQSAVCTTNESVSVTVTVKNRSPLFFPRGEVRLRVRHAFGSKYENLKIKFPVQENNSTRLTFYIKPARCGIVTAEIRSVRIYDVLRLFHTNIPDARKNFRLLVLPKPVTLPMDSSAPPVENPESIRFADRPGDDPSELFGIREYQAGDPVSRIHWKLSSRLDVLLLKQFGAPVDKHTLLLAEYRCGSREQELLTTESFLTMLYSIARQLLESGHPCTIAWYDADSDTVIRTDPSEPSGLEETFRQLYGSLFSISVDDEKLRETLGAEAYSSAVVLTNLPDTRMLGFIENAVSANVRSLILLSDEKNALHSEFTEIHQISPRKLRINRLIV